MLTHAFTEKPIVLGSGDEPEDEDDDLDKAHAPIVVGGEQQDHDALDLDIPPSPFGTSVDQVEDGGFDGGDSDIGHNIPPRGAKRQRSGSHLCGPNLHHTGMPPLSHHEDGESNLANACWTCSDNSGGDRILSKRRKLPDSMNIRTTSSSHDAQSPHYLSPALGESEKQENDERDVSTNLPVEDNLTSTPRTTPELSVCGYPRKPQLSPELADPAQDWEVSEIIGKEYINGEVHYMVKWSPTLEPASSLEHAKELVDEFEARLRALHSGKGRRVGSLAKQGRPAIKKGNIIGAKQQQRPRGQPRK